MYNSTWYNGLTKPPFSPPDWLFAPVWSVLYFLILLSLIIYSVKKTNLNKVKGYVCFGLQIILNFLWSPAFFALKNITLALIIVILLNIFIIMTVRYFFAVSKVASLLLVPYLIWTLFATYLNFSYLILN